MSATKYSEELAQSLCDRISSGAPLVRACRELEIDPATVWRWRQRHADFRDNYDLAQQHFSEVIASEVIDITDTDPDPQRARNRAESRKWYAGCILPRKFGPRAQLDVTVDDRTNFGALHAEALARAARLGASVTLSPPDIEDAEIIPPPALPVGEETEDPFA